MLCHLAWIRFGTVRPVIQWSQMTKQTRHQLSQHQTVSQTARKSPDSKAERLLRQEKKERIRSKRAEEQIHPRCEIALFIGSNADGPSRLWERTGAAVPNLPRGMCMCHSRSLINSRFVTCAGRDSGLSVSLCMDEAKRPCLISRH